MKIKIYVAMHKIVELKLSKCYVPILVGSFNKQNNNILRDDEGTNISKKNPNYCELTALYWMWKNSDADIVGLCHYRRFFFKNIFSNNIGHILSEIEIKRLMDNYDIIVPKKHYLKKSIWNGYEKAPSKEDMAIIENIIKKDYPEYLNALEEYNSGNYSYLYNMFVAKKEIIDNYCRWLFEILENCEKCIDVGEEGSYHSRIYGFLSERLFNVWILKNKDDLKVKELTVLKTDQSNFKNYKTIINQIFIKYNGVNR